jgi:hypothetical protein
MFLFDTEVTGGYVLFNLDHVISVMPQDKKDQSKGSVLFLSDGISEVKVRETLNQIYDHVNMRGQEHGSQHS